MELIIPNPANTLEVIIPDWDKLKTNKKAIEKIANNLLPSYLLKCRWFGGKARKLKKISIEHHLEIPLADVKFFFLILNIDYNKGESENYFLPVSFIESITGEVAVNPKAIIAAAKVDVRTGYLVDAIYDQRFQHHLFNCLNDSTKIDQYTGQISFMRGKGFLPFNDKKTILSRVLEVDQSNSSLIFEEKYFLKIYRKLFRETNPEVEVIRFLTENGNYENIPAFAGSFAWEREGIEPITLGLMMEKVTSLSDSWVYTGDNLNDFLYGFLNDLFTIKENVFEKVDLLAKRTAEMHLALFTKTNDPGFKAEKFDKKYSKWFNDHLQKLLTKRIDLLKENFSELDPTAQDLANTFIESEKIISEFFNEIQHRNLDSMRTRIHGDYHLGQVLFTGSDYIIIDFEGEPESSISDRKIKHSPLKDVAGMIRSFHYSVCAKLYFSNETAGADVKQLQKAADRWYRLITDTFLDTYMAAIGKDSGLFKNKSEINFLLQLHLLEKAVYELGYELNGRPHWIKIPLKGITHVLNEIEKLKD